VDNVVSGKEGEKEEKLRPEGYTKKGASREHGVKLPLQAERRISKIPELSSMDAPVRGEKRSLQTWRKRRQSEVRKKLSHRKQKNHTLKRSTPRTIDMRGGGGGGGRTRPEVKGRRGEL